jgi:hypothetical protein
VMVPGGTFVECELPLFTIYPETEAARHAKRTDAYALTESQRIQNSLQNHGDSGWYNFGLG